MVPVPAVPVMPVKVSVFEFKVLLMVIVWFLVAPVLENVPVA
jgi:hypothetical protein